MVGVPLKTAQGHRRRSWHPETRRALASAKRSPTDLSPMPHTGRPSSSTFNSSTLTHHSRPRLCATSACCGKQSSGRLWREGPEKRAGSRSESTRGASPAVAEGSPLHQGPAGTVCKKKATISLERPGTQEHPGDAATPTGSYSTAPSWNLPTPTSKVPTPAGQP